jgi:hypothetical protein
MDDIGMQRRLANGAGRALEKKSGEFAIRLVALAQIIVPLATLPRLGVRFARITLRL